VWRQAFVVEPRILCSHLVEELLLVSRTRGSNKSMLICDMVRKNHFSAVAPRAMANPRAIDDRSQKTVL